MIPGDLTLVQASRLIRNKELSPVELVSSALARIEQVEPMVGAFVTVLAESAMDTATQAADEIARGEYRGGLHGIPIGIKDLIDIAGIPTTCSSKVRAEHVPAHDSAVTERLQAAGAVVVGKTQTHEFAHGTYTPATRNPWDLTRTAGGSSGGSAAAVASGSILLGLGTDTCGSIRIPAALCGTTGLKPTFGRVSRRGVASLSWSLDHVGPLTRTVEDAALVLKEIAGHDPNDPGSCDVPVPDYSAALAQGVRGLRIGVPSNYFTDRVDPEIAATTTEWIGLLRELGCAVREVVVPFEDQLMAAEFVILMPEASAYHQSDLRRRPDDYGPEVRALLVAGELVMATDYIKALRVRSLIKEGFRKLFDDVDVILAPTVTTPALPMDALEVAWPDGTVESTVTYNRFSAPANLTGLPALTVPTRCTKEGLPMGIQIIGRPFDEATVLAVGHACQSATGVPPLAPI